MTLLERFQLISLGKSILLGIFISAIYYAIGFDSGELIVTGTNQAKEQILQAESEIKGLERKLERIGVMKKVMEELGVEFKSFLSYIPENLSMSELMRAISQEAKAAGVNINRIGEMGSSGNVSKDKNEFYTTLTVQVELQGSFAQILLFLSYLTKLNRILTVDEIDLITFNGNQENDNPGVVFKGQITGYKYLKTNDDLLSGGSK